MFLLYTTIRLFLFREQSKLQPISKKKKKMDKQRQELDELMGRDRNKSMKERMGKVDHYTNQDVCKYFLVSICPHDLFPNTKYDLGNCNKRHDEYLKRQFDREPDDKKILFEKQCIQETIAVFENLVSQIDAIIRKSQAKIEIPIMEGEKSDEINEKVHALDEQIAKFLDEIEVLGDQGKIEESERLNEEVEKLKKNREELVLTGENPVLAQKQMKVCDICGAKQPINDTEKRTITHLEGKMHKGFAAIRKELEKLKRRKDMIRFLVRENQEKGIIQPKIKEVAKDEKKEEKPREKERSEKGERSEKLEKGERDPRDVLRESKIERERRRSRSRSHGRKKDHGSNKQKHSKRDKDSGGHADRHRRSRSRSKGKSDRDQRKQRSQLIDQMK